MSNLLLTRHAVLDKYLQVEAYTLDCALLESDSGGGDQPATSLPEALIEIGIEEIAGHGKLYIGCSPPDAEPLIELCATSHLLGLYLSCTPDTLQKACDVIRLCVDRSISIAISSPRPDILPAEILVNTDMAFVTARDISTEAEATWIRRLNRYRARAGAANIGSNEQFQAACDAGYERFQGTFLQAPSHWTGRKIPEGSLSPLRLLSKLQNPDTTTAEIEQLVKADAALSYRVLRWVNSSYYGIGIEIDHIGHAIVYLGLAQLKALISVLALARLRPASPELLVLSATRARMSELLASEMGLEPFRAFTLGLFSLVDIITKAPLDKVLATVSLHHDITNALLSGTGPYGELLNLVTNYEKGNWKALKNHHGAERLGQIYRESVQWASSHGLGRDHSVKEREAS